MQECKNAKTILQKQKKTQKLQICNSQNLLQDTFHIVKTYDIFVTNSRDID